MKLSNKSQKVTSIMSLSHLSNFLVFMEMANLGELKVNLDSSTFSIEIYGGDVLKLLSIKVRSSHA